MKQRVITGALFAIAMLAGIYFQGWVMLVLLSLSMLIATQEMYRALRSTGIEPVRWAGYTFCALTIIVEAVTLATKNYSHLSLVPLLLGMMLAMLRLVMHGKIAVESLMATVFPMLYPGIFFMVLMELLHLENRAVTATALVLAFFAASINDVFALFTGMLLGRHKLSPELSPKKTIEGSIGGMIFCIGFCVAVPPLLKLIFSFDPSFAQEIAVLPPLWSFAILGLVAGVFSQIGDLTASMIKRHCGVKDYGRLLPGHGGIMDRLDGVLFCGATCYIFFRMAGLG